MPGGVVLAGLDRPMCAKLLSAAGPAEASSEVCASLRRGLEAPAGRRAGRCGGCDSAAQAARSAHSTTARMPPPDTASNWKLVECDEGDYLRGEHRTGLDKNYPLLTLCFLPSPPCSCAPEAARDVRRASALTRASKSCGAGATCSAIACERRGRSTRPRGDVGEPRACR